MAQTLNLWLSCVDLWTTWDLSAYQVNPTYSMWLCEVMYLFDKRIGPLKAHLFLPSVHLHVAPFPCSPGYCDVQYLATPQELYEECVPKKIKNKNKTSASIHSSKLACSLARACDLWLSTIDTAWEWRASEKHSRSAYALRYRGPAHGVWLSHQVEWLA